MNSDVARQEAEANRLAARLATNTEDPTDGFDDCADAVGEYDLDPARHCHKMQDMQGSAALWPSQPGDRVGNLSCAVDYHNIEYFGLAYCDHTLRGITADDWEAPTEHERIENAEHIRSLLRYHVN